MNLPARRCDVVLVGGGLANSLIALELRHARPELDIVLLERKLGAPDSHTWCVFKTDLLQQSWRRLEPLFDHVWQGYDVVFPGHDRALSTPYACLTARTLGSAVAAQLGVNLVRGAAVERIDAQGASCADGQRFDAPLVIDGRGAAPSAHLVCAFQKFVGLELQLLRPHHLQRPILMDASVRQDDGFRFIYVLPLGPDTLLIEDTRYSGDAALDCSTLEAGVLRYARARGWKPIRTIRRETGVLPVVLGGDIEAYWREQGDLPLAGMRGGFFHPTTGYSLPEAQRVAELICASRLTTPSVAKSLHAHALALWRARGFYLALNRMMMVAASPDRRYRVLERFYRLPQASIERFYAGRLTLLDKTRLLAGRPPLPIGRALSVLPARTAYPAHA